jgi:hypothetical protein
MEKQHSSRGVAAGTSPMGQTHWTIAPWTHHIIPFFLKTIGENEIDNSVSQTKNIPTRQRKKFNEEGRLLPMVGKLLYTWLIVASQGCPAALHSLQHAFVSHSENQRRHITLSPPRTTMKTNQTKRKHARTQDSKNQNDSRAPHKWQKTK